MRRAILVTLLSSLTLTAAASPVPQLNDAPAPASPRISTGVTAPRLVHASHIGIPANAVPAAFGSSAKVVLKVDLDATGMPTSISVLQPVTPELDERVIDGVRRFRWTPAVLNNQPVPTDVTLTVEVQR